MLVHPLTGEVLPEEDERRVRAAVLETDERIDAHYRDIGRLRESRNLLLAELPVSAVPRPRDRTVKQGALVRCPNCGTRIA